MTIPDVTVEEGTVISIPFALLHVIVGAALQVEPTTTFPETSERDFEEANAVA